MGPSVRVRFALLLGLLIGIRIDVEAAIPVGCFQDSPLTSSFVATPGGFNPSLGITADQCAFGCFALKYPFAGVQQGLYCFCGLADYQVGMVAGTVECNTTCSDGSPCGGPSGWTSVYTSTPAKPTVEGLKIAVVDTMAPLLADEASVNLVINVTTNRTLLNFIINAGDGSEPASFPGDSSMLFPSFPITFSKPGTFTISVTADFKNGVGYASSAKTVVTVVDAPMFNYTCPLAVDASQPFTCTASQTLGYDSTEVNALWNRPAPGVSDNLTYAVPDPTYMGVGAMFPSLASPAANGSEVAGADSGTFKIRSAYFAEPGLVTDLEAYVMASGAATVTFSVATGPTCPTATPVFCPNDRKCHAAACTMSACANKFCAYGGSCCPADAGALPTNYGTTALLATASITTLNVPHRITAQPVNVYVPAGGVLMVDCPSPCQLFYRLPRTGEPGDINALAVDTGMVHLARAHVVNQTEILLRGKCNSNYENITTAFSIANVAGAGAMPASQVISCQTPIVNMSVTVDNLVAVYEDINMTITMDKGAPVDISIQWDETNTSTVVIGPSTSNYTFPIAVPHSYGKDGVFSIKINATNMLSGLQGNDYDNVTTQVAVYYPVNATWTLTPVGLTQNILITPPGSLQYQLAYTGTTPLPTNATAVVYTGDGGQLTMPVNSSMILFDSYTYLANGDFMIYANMSNAYNSMLFNLNIAAAPSNLTVWQAISNVTAQFRFVTDGSGPAGLPGSGPDQMDFPMEWNTTILPLVGAGVVESYSVYWANNNSLIGSYPVADKFYPNNESILLPIPRQEGLYNITLSACNQVQGCVNSSIIYPVRILGRVVNITIDDYRQIVAPNNNKSLQLLFESMGGSTCALISWGDGSLEMYGTYATCQSVLDISPGMATYYPTPPLSNPMPLMHNYKREGIYEMSVTAWNALSSASATLSIVAADIPCLTPLVWITQPANGMIFKKPETILINGETRISCNLTSVVGVSRAWRLFLMNETTNDVANEVVIKGNLSSWDRVQLAIPGLFLPYGRYRLTFTSRLTGSPVLEKYAVERTAEDYIEITKSELRAVIYDGGITKILKAAEGDFVVLRPGELSSDPDDPSGSSPYPMFYQWVCTRESENVSLVDWNSTQLITIPTANVTPPADDSGGCFGTGPGRLNFNSSRITLSTSLLYKKNETYRFTVRVLKDTRIAEAVLEVQTQSGISPLGVAMECMMASACLPPSGGAIYMNQFGNFTIRAACQQNCDPLSPKLYRWFASIESAPNTYQAVASTSLQYFPFGADQSELFIHSSFFDRVKNISANWRYKLRVVVNDTTSQSFGFSEYVFTINRPAEAGSCSCSGDRYPFVVLLTYHTCTCSGWRDPEGAGIATYQFVTSRTDIASLPFTYEPSDFPQQTMILGVGRYQITCRITDKWGTVVESPVSVYPTSNDTATDLLQATMEIPTKEQYEDYKEQDLRSSYQVAFPGLLKQLDIAESQILAEATWMSLDTSSLSQEELMDRVDQRIEQIDSMLNNQGAQSNILTPQQAMSAGSLLGNVWGNINPDTMEAGVVSIGALKSTETLMSSINSLLSNGDQMPMPDLVDLSTSILSAANLGPVLSSLIDSGDCDEEPKPNFAFCRPLDMDQNTYDPYFPPLDIDKVESNNITVERCCYLAEERRYRAGGVTKSIDATLQTLAQEMIKQMVVGQKEEIGSSNGKSVMTVEKLISAAVRGTTRDLPMDVRLNIPSGFPCPGGDCSAPVGISSVVHERNIIVGENLASQRITKGSPTVSFDFFDAAGSLIDIKDLEEPIELFIPRDPIPESEKRPFTCVNTSQELTNTSIKIIYSKITPAHASDAAFIEFMFKNASVAFPNMYILLGIGRLPLPINGLFDSGIAVADMQMDMYGAYTATLQAKDMGIVDRTTLADSKKALYVGVFELKDGLTFDEVASSANLENYKNNLKDKMSANYCLRTTDGGPSYFNKTQWSNEGLKVVYMDWTGMKIEITHLSMFGAGFFVQPNTVDFNYVFANAGFQDNLTIYVTLIVTVVVYIVILIWARMKDLKDVEQLHALSLPDNRKEHKYLYEILVLTGDQNCAMTDSKVSFVISGENDETDVRTFGKPNQSKRRFFRKGQMDSFVMSCPRPLGNMNYIRLWHDCSGEGIRSSWFCTYLVFRDVQTNEKFEFIVNDWLALDESDGSVDRLIPVAGEEQKREFKYLFNTSKSSNLRDEHLWFSVFLRPPQSRFTRAQRVSCCMALLYLSMLVNAMWYGTVKEQPTVSSMKFGPFSLGLEQVGVGFMSNLIVLLPSMLIVTLFRKARPKRLRKSRIDEALREHGCLDESKPATKAKLTKKCTLPWWFTIVAWILCIICMAASVFFLWAYGISFGNEKTSKWISSLIISFFSSVLFVQPIKVLIMACVFSAICKKETDIDDYDEDEEDPRLDYNEEYIDDSEPVKKRTIGFKPLDNELLEIARIQRLREKMMWSVMKEIIFYTIYLVAMYIIASGNRDPNALLMKKHFVKTYIRPTFQDWSVPKMTTENDFWNWTHNILMSKMRAQSWYNGDSAYGLRGFTDDRNNRMMGYGIFRQIRVQENTCVIPRTMRMLNITQCSDYTEYTKEERRNFCTMWRRQASFIPDADCNWEEFKYRTAEELEALPLMGTLDGYTGGGYVIQLAGRDSELRDRLVQLQRAEWTNHLTRAIFVEFSVYNANANLFCVASLLFEMVPGGGIVPSYRFDGIRLMQHHTGFGMVVVVAEALFIMYTLYYTVVFFRGVCKGKMAYLRLYWTMWEMVQLFLSYVGVGLHVYRWFQTKVILEKFEQTMGNGYIRMQQVNLVDSFVGSIIGILVFMGTITYLKLLRFNRRMGILAETMRACWDDMIGFGFVFGMFFAGFVLMFYMFLNRQLYEWSNFTMAAETSFSMLLGKFDFQDIKQSNIIAALMFVFYSVSMSLIMINVFLTIVIKAFEEVKKDIANQTDEIQVIRYMRERLGTFVGTKKVNTIKPVQVETEMAQAEASGENSKKQVAEFPNKVDKMLDHINTLFFNGEVDIHNKTWLKKMAAKQQGQQ